MTAPRALTWIALVVALAVVAPVAAAGNVDQSRSLACLAHRGSAVSKVLPLDGQRRSLRDLAQRRAFQVGNGPLWVAVAFTSSRSSAQLLHELLAVPNQPYRLRISGTALLMYPRAAGRAASRVAACLLPPRG